MDPLVLGGLVAGAGSIIGGGMSASAARENAEKNIEMQREFAKNGIRWKVEDAQRAGLHPLAALGANTTSFSPISVGDTSIGSGVSQMGQDIGRAIQATRTQDERQDAIMNLQLERAKLENDEIKMRLAGSKMALLNQAGGNPPMPKVIEKPMERTVSPNGSTYRTVGDVPDFTYVRTPQGGLAIAPSKDVKELVEDQVIQESNWAFRNNILPNFNPSAHMPPASEYPPPKGTRWEWSYKYQQFMPTPAMNKSDFDRLSPAIRRKMR